MRRKQSSSRISSHTFRFCEASFIANTFRAHSLRSNNSPKVELNFKIDHFDAIDFRSTLLLIPSCCPKHTLYERAHDDTTPLEADQKFSISQCQRWVTRYPRTRHLHDLLLIDASLDLPRYNYCTHITSSCKW
jgi:hypothetical protein